MNVFQLKKPIVIPAYGRPNKGLLVFLPGDFVVLYEVVSNPSAMLMDITLLLVDTLDGVKIPLQHFAVTEKGFWSGLYSNQDEIDAYHTDKESQIALVTSLREAAAEEAVSEEANDSSVTAQYLTEMRKLSEWPPEPQPVPVMVNTYSEVLQYFNSSMTLTQEGLEWGKTLPLLKGKMEDYLCFPLNYTDSSK